VSLRDRILLALRWRDLQANQLATELFVCRADIRHCLRSMMAAGQVRRILSNQFPGIRYTTLPKTQEEEVSSPASAQQIAGAWDMVDMRRVKQ